MNVIIYRLGKKKKRLTFLVMLMLTILIVPDLKSQETDTLLLSLSDAISIGLENNYQIRISREELKIARNNNTPGAAGRYPSLDFTAVQLNSFNNSQSLTYPDTRSKLTSSSISPAVNLNWTIFDGFRVNITRKNLQSLEQLSEGLSTVVVENTIQSIILSYYNILLQKEKLRVFEEVKKLSGDRMQYMKVKQQFGSAVTYDVLQANDAYLSDSVNYLSQELNLKNAVLLLKLLLAMDQTVQFKLTDEFSVLINDYKLDDLMNKMLENNKNLRNQYINQKILENSTSLAKSQYYPGVYLGAGADYSNSRFKYAGEDPGTRYSFGYYVNFTLNFNLFNGGATRRAVQNALINEDIGLITVSEMTKALTNQMVNQFDLFGIRRQLLMVADVSQESTGLNLQISEDKFKSGAINSFNFRDIQLRYLNASIRRLEAIYNLINTETELLRLTGGIISEE
jgi:outer membrane protein TolC